MNSSDIPSRTLKAFSVNGDKNSIPIDSSSTTLADGSATFDSGFPPLTMTPISAGGKPPKGKDMNGILYAVTIKQKWQDAGMGYPFDSTFSTNLLGYPKGAILPNSLFSGCWLNTTENNSNSPEASGATSTGWVPINGYGSSTVNMTNANGNLSTLLASKDRIIINGALTANLYLYFPPWQKEWTVENNTTGGFTVTCITPAPGASGAVSTSKSVMKIYCDGTNISSYTQPKGMMTFTGSGSFTVPSGVTRIKVTCVGGGGGGGGCQASSLSNTFSGSGGGAGGTAIGYFGVIPGSSLSVVVGNGGTGGPGAAPGGNGTSSSVSGLCSAAGGEGGRYAPIFTAGGAGGTASGGNTNITGGYGGDGQARSSLMSGYGGASSQGGGGRSGNLGGINGSAYGSGGGGAYDPDLTGSIYNGGVGKSGVVTIEW
ncbi:hypothetical protein [Serratia quinivorans]|uniref:glycine-rich domain-containing protein n=1 Tax=Serratia quinivorans TaxID=137545 RepID=UPI0034C66364